MSEASFASLNQSLLARKGGAKPAMRPQLGPITANTAQAAADLEDLGWNDMGHDETAKVVPIQPASNDEIPTLKLATKTSSIEPMRKASAPAKRAKAKSGKRAAFTLRLDAERHLKLRLASTIMGQSAQQLVTDALDNLLAGIEDLESLAARMKRR
jgi:predicted HicB family RNase H-like nuclease